MSFDRLAPHYRWMESVLTCKTLQRARTEWLQKVTGTRRALLVGEGNGRFLTAALAALPDTQFLYIDASSAMLRIAQRDVRQQDRSRVEFLCRTLPDWTPPSDPFDLIVTHFFLDCFHSTHLERVIATLEMGANSQSSWLIADFSLPPCGPARWRAIAIHQLMYAFFRRTTGISAHSWVSPDPLLASLGFARTHLREFEWGLIRSTLWRRHGLGPIETGSACANAKPRITVRPTEI
jgi:ubiquinone/menaquinone biosynthesis C-methylase UbiE